MRRGFGDRRRHQRFDIDGDLLGTLTSTHRLRITNMGLTGALVQTFAPLPVHSVYDAKIALAPGELPGGDSEEFDIRFRVRHVRHAEADRGQYLMGVEFLELPPRAAMRIEELLAAEGGGEAVQV